MTCALCLEDRPLRNSHILPEFTYRPLYDPKHRFNVLYESADRCREKEQKGLREKLLCADCETQLSKYERYASRVFSSKTPVSSRIDGKLVYINGLDYEPFKLFGLSILWRCGVSTLEAFQQVKLGPHAESLRKLLVAADPGPVGRYPFILNPLLHNGEVLSELIVPPSWARVHGHKCYRIVFCGLIWIFHVSNRPPPLVFNHCALNKQGTLIMNTADIPEVPFLMDMLHGFARKKRL